MLECLFNLSTAGKVVQETSQFGELRIIVLEKHRSRRQVGANDRLFRDFHVFLKVNIVYIGEKTI